MKLRVIIIDDEKLARERLRRLLGTRVEILAECVDGPSAVEAILALQPDLIFLDIQMPGMDGFEVIHAIGHEQLPAVVFVTGFDAHAIRAFEERALDYLLKPTNATRLAETLDRAEARLKNSETLPPELLSFLASQNKTILRRVSVRHGERLIFVPVEEIVWIEAAGNYAILHTAKESHICRETMTSFERQLPDQFQRVSRSAIINLHEIREIQNMSVGEHVAILSNAAVVSITRSLREVESRLKHV